MTKNTRNLLLVLAALLLAAVTGITAYALGQPTTVTMTLIQDAPALAEHPAVEAGKTGNAVYFEADLSFSDGTAAGILVGKTELIDVTFEATEDQIRNRTLVFQLDDGQIVVGGVSGYTPVGNPSFGSLKTDGASPLPELAILGGTQKYVGVTGYVTTEERDDRTYVHTLVLTR